MIPIQNKMSAHEITSYYTTFAETPLIATHVFSYLSAKELVRCLSVCKQWNEFANNDALWNALVPENAFGPRQWARYYGEIGEVPPLPREIYQILNASCPIWPDKKVHETHLLTLIPAIVNGKHFTLNSLRELIQRPHGGGKAMKYRNYWDEIQKEYGDTALTASYWVFMTKDVIPESRSKTHEAQKQLLATYSQKSHLPYEIPLLLEAAASILMEHVHSGTRLYSDSPWTYTRCQEKVSSHLNWPLVVGGFDAGGLRVNSPDYDGGHEDCGVGGCFRF